VNQSVENETRSDDVELRIPCRAEWVALARLAVSAIANRLRFTIEDIEDIKLAVAEACTAVIQHEKHGENIDITFQTTPYELRLHIRDTGRKALAAVRPAVDLDEARIAGLGIFLIRTLMDEVHYDVHADGGTNLEMVKRLGRQPV
jgi:serine/threonine-protein kinase RsbW